MRQIGTIESDSQARRFQSYLLAQQIESRMDQSEGGWEVWILDDDHLDKARQQLAEFKEQPDKPIYKEAEEAAARYRAEKDRQLTAALRRKREVRKAMQPPTWNDAPLTLFLMLASILVTVAMELENNPYGLETQLSIVEYGPQGENHIAWEKGFQEIRQGEIWRVITPIFVHYGPMHILFNMSSMYYLGFLIEPRIKTWRFLLYVLLIGVISNFGEYYLGHAFQSWTPNPSFGGMSGVLCGLFGYVWMKGVYEPEMGIGMQRSQVHFVLGFLILCTTGIFGPIADAAHFTGLAVGCLIALVRPVYRRLAGT